MAAVTYDAYKDEMPAEFAPLSQSQGVEALKDITYGSVSLIIPQSVLLAANTLLDCWNRGEIYRIPI
jgi:hypothetical protein